MLTICIRFWHFEVKITLKINLNKLKARHSTLSVKKIKLFIFAVERRVDDKAIFFNPFHFFTIEAISLPILFEK